MTLPANRLFPRAPASGGGAPAMVTIAGLDPPADATALALTFARAVAP